MKLVIRSKSASELLSELNQAVDDGTLSKIHDILEQTRYQRDGCQWRRESQNYFLENGIDEASTILALVSATNSRLEFQFLSDNEILVDDCKVIYEDILIYLFREQRDRLELVNINLTPRNEE